MHDIKWIRENPAAFDRGLARRGLAPQAERVLAIDERRRAVIQKLEGAQARRNAASKEIGQAKAKKDEATAQALMAEVAELKTLVPAMEAEEKEGSKKLDDALAEIPNLPLDEVPDGKDAEDNVQHHHFGAERNYAFSPKQHFELGEALGQMDFETAAKLSGARFVVLKQWARAARTRDRAVHARYPHSPAWIYGGQPAVTGPGRCHVWYGTTAEVRRRSIPNHDGPLAHSHRRSPAHEPRPRVDRRGSRVAYAAHRVDAVLSGRSRRGRQGHTRHDPPAPIHQGRARLDHHAGSQQGRA